MTLGATGGAADDLVVMRGTLMTTGNAGRVIYQWCQSTSNAGNTTVRAGASMYIKRVA